jgi:hypothetical protein
MVTNNNEELIEIAIFSRVFMLWISLISSNRKLLLTYENTLQHFRPAHLGAEINRIEYKNKGAILFKL